MRPYLRQPFRQKSKAWIAEQQFILSNFSGGLNNVSPENTLDDNEFTDTKNMRFVGDNLLEKRNGIQYYNQELYPDLDGAVTWVDSFKPLNGAEQLVRATNNKVYIGSTKVADVNGSIQGVNFYGRYYFVDGTNLYMYNSGDVFRVLSDPHTQIVEDVDNTQKYFIVEDIPEQVAVGDKISVFASMLLGYSGQEKYLTRTITAIDTENNKVTFDSTFGYPINGNNDGSTNVIYFFALDDKDVQGKEVSNGNAGWIYYQPCYLQLADSDFGFSSIPDAPKVLTVHQNRLVISGDTHDPHTVQMSTIVNTKPTPIYFPYNAGLSCTPDGKEVVDCFTFDNALIIGRHEDLFVVYGDTESSSGSGTKFYMKKMDATTGLMSSHCGALLNNYYFYLGYDGRFYALNTPTTFVEYLVTKPLDWKVDIFKAPFASLVRGNAYRVNAIPYHNEVYFALPNDIVIIYNYDNRAYTYFSGWNAKTLYTDGSKLVIGTADGKFALWRDDSDMMFDDFGSAIDARLSTKRYDLNMTANFKYFKQFMVTSHAYGFSNSNIDVDIEADCYSIGNNADFQIASQNATFGISEWGRALFGNQEVLKSRWYNVDIRARNIKFTFRNNNIDAVIDPISHQVVGYQGEPMRLYDLTVLWGIRDIR